MQQEKLDFHIILTEYRVETLHFSVFQGLKIQTHKHSRQEGNRDAVHPALSQCYYRQKSNRSSKEHFLLLRWHFFLQFQPNFSMSVLYCYLINADFSVTLSFAFLEHQKLVSKTAGLSSHPDQNINIAAHWPLLSPAAWLCKDEVHVCQLIYILLMHVSQLRNVC